MPFPNLMTWIENHDKMIDWLQRKAPKRDKAVDNNNIMTDGDAIFKQVQEHLLRSRGGMETHDD